MTLAAYQGRCPTCGRDGTRETEEFRQWFESRVHLEDGCEIGVGQLAARPDAEQVGTSNASEPEPLSPPSGGAEPVAWLTTGGDVTRSHAYAVEQSVNDPDNYPQPLYALAQPGSDGEQQS